MRDYKPKPSAKYWLRHNLYMRMKYLVRDYEHKKAEYHAILDESPMPPDGMPRGTDVSDPVARKAIRREKLSHELEAVERGLLAVPEAYRAGVWDNVRRGDWFPQTAHKDTWRRWTRRFLWHVAEKLGEI